MLVARPFDVSDAEGPYVSAARPRLAEPERRSRVAGYLGTAPPVGGYRTDGEWVWPDALAEAVRRYGVGPQRELLQHIEARHWIVPDEVSSDTVDRAARAIAEGPAPLPSSTGDRYLADGDESPTYLVRLARAEDGSSAEATLGPYGWRPSPLPPSDHGRIAGLQPISGRAAAELADALCARWHKGFMDRTRETEQTGPGPRLARLFDGESPAGSPWFTPSRLRILEPERRRRLVAYLSRGRLVMRATGRMVDSLDPDRGRVVPLNYRTDGAWVWPEALSYYLRHRGVAPELALLCHIEERGIQLPDVVADGAVAAAVAAVKGAPGRRLEPLPFAYFLDDPTGELLARCVEGQRSQAEILSPYLRWRSSADGWADPWRNGHQFHEIAEAQAIAIIDDRWAQLSTAQG